MIRINFYCIGKLNEKYLSLACDDFSKRLSKYCKLNIEEFNDSKIESYDNMKLINKTLDEEASNVLKKVSDKDYVVLLDLHGKELSSEEFASKINDISNTNSIIDFIIGGTLGVSENLRKRANFRLSISKFTFTHKFTRVIMLEQLYRAFKINNNESYHH